MVIKGILKPERDLQRGWDLKIRGCLSLREEIVVSRWV